MNRRLIMAAICCGLSSWSIASTPDPELAKLLQEYGAVQKARRGWHREGQTPAFRQKVMALQKKAVLYTRVQADAGLPSWEWGGKFFWSLYRDYLLLTLSTYEECEEAVREMRDVLGEVERRDPATAARLSLDLVADVVMDRVSTHPLECAELWDEESARVAARERPELQHLQRAHASRIEGWLLKYAGRVPEEERAAFFDRRYRNFAALLNDESLPVFRRTKMLSRWIVYRNAFGRWNDASRVVEDWWVRYGAEISEPDFYLSRMWVAWYGEGDWEKASETLRRFSQLAREGKAQPAPGRYRKMTDIYYTRIFLPGQELKRLQNEKARDGK